VNDTVTIIALAGGSAAIVGLIGLVALRLIRGRSLRAGLFSIALSSILAMVAGTVAAAHAMVIKSDFVPVLMISACAGLVALMMAGLLGRSVAADSKALRSALRSLGNDPEMVRRQNATAQAAKLATSEMGALSRELEATTMRLAESRERERALERSRRELVAWVHTARGPTGDGRGARGRRRHRPAALLRSDAAGGGAPHRNGRRPFRALKDPRRGVAALP
jgi:hypothetical protein